MLKKLKALWDLTRKDTVLSNFVAGLLVALILYLISKLPVLFEGAKSTDLTKQVITILNINLPLWAYVLVLMILAALWFTLKRLKSYFAKKEDQVNPSPLVHAKTTTNQVSEPEQLEQWTAVDPTPDSNQITREKNKRAILFYWPQFNNFLFKIYGERNWDANLKALVGEPGQGYSTIDDNVLTIHRLTSAGRFIIKLAQYYPFGVKSLLVPCNLSGRNPKDIQVKFESRCLKGSHQIKIIVRRANSHDWLNHAIYDLSNIEWLDQTAGFKIPADEDFVIEFDQVTLTGTNGTIQFRAIQVIEFYV